MMSSYHKSKLQMSPQLAMVRATTEIPAHTRCLHIMYSLYMQINIHVTKQLLKRLSIKVIFCLLYFLKRKEEVGGMKSPRCVRVGPSI
jgi:hypothetical protein